MGASLATESNEVSRCPDGMECRTSHVLNRLAYGPRPGDVQHVNAIGVEHYIQEQLSPDSIAIPERLTNRLAALDTTRMTPVQLFVKYGRPEMGAGGPDGAKPDQAQRKEARQRAHVIVQQAVAARLMRAIESPRQLQEVMVDFWFNHFNVFAAKGLDHLWVGAYEAQAIRPHVFGRFRDLLEATARHPAMLFYLDNWQNTAPDSPGARGKFEGLNENYARELMELHTLGVNGGYTQNDVIALARILTGWGLAPRRPRAAVAKPGGFFGLRRGFGFFRPRQPAREVARGDANGFYFDPKRHDFTDKIFLGYHIKGSGSGEVESALDILARSPATARHISYQLAQFFVADDPPESLVRRMADRFTTSDGNIRAVLNSMFQSREFWDRRYVGAKFKTPQQYVISSVRASGIDVANFRLIAGTLSRLGMPFYGCLTPDGYKNTQDAWLNPDAMMIRLSLATGLASGRMPLNRAPIDPMGGDERVTPVAAVSANGPGGAPRPLDPFALMLTLGNGFSPRTIAAIESAPPELRAALILGSPEFMRR
ncbi:MAG: DUF1800 domain-containing protein [Candidatus Binataceae bacterium]|jgi:uncharacterized protein (DUF1800 family)